MPVIARPLATDRSGTSGALLLGMGHTLNRPIRTLILGGLLGIAATLAGTSLAHADCAHDEHELNVWRAEATCDEWAQQTAEDYLLPMGEDGLMSADEYDRQLGSMYEACVRLATPVTVLPAAQHYDTTDGAFWRGER